MLPIASRYVIKPRKYSMSRNWLNLKKLVEGRRQKGLFSHPDSDDFSGASGVGNCIRSATLSRHASSAHITHSSLIYLCMKFALLTALMAGAALVQVGASPLRVVLVTSTSTSTNGQDLPVNIRFGHAVPNTNANNNGITNPLVATMVANRPAIQAGRSCRGGRFRQKAIEMSNTFRKALGWPLIETAHDHSLAPLPPPSSQPGRVHILPITGSLKWFVTPPHHADDAPNPYIAHPHPRPQTHGGRVSHVHRLKYALKHAPFVHRLHVALMALGPWEGRAVAFVLGCGIGVLLRMFWVLAIVSYRLIKGRREDENRYTEIFVVEEYEDAPPAPPTYTYADEKADKKDGEATTPAAAN
ncbi:hypothetical protein LshimejAT787_1900700 [Lyophyllum shimeji]|uniref:Uncharacterized protein n=1 Tax=Lyophyllum shimeji TaxID=47721 RepID=A0A9P3PXR8_LYOSH|nr:hypothetical protein LshimejAT787_1900700 [Lyophyllum shimeji]